MDPGKAVPVTTAARLRRWCLFLGAFAYQMEYRGSKQHANCDGLSRLPLRQVPEDKPDEVEMFHRTTVTERELRRETLTDALCFSCGTTGGVMLGRCRIATELRTLPQSQGRTDNASWFSDVG